METNCGNIFEERDIFDKAMLISVLKVCLKTPTIHFLITFRRSDPGSVFFETGLRMPTGKLFPSCN
jgi:hypothetical protein